MRIFEHFNKLGKQKVCPICKKDTDKQVCLIGIAGTEDGGVIEALQFHVDCLNFVYHKDYPYFEEDKKESKNSLIWTNPSHAELNKFVEDCYHKFIKGE